MLTCVSASSVTSVWTDTVYVPAASYVKEGLKAVEVCPLPKSQAYVAPAFHEVGPLNGQRRTALVGTPAKPWAITTFTGFNNQGGEILVYCLLETKRRQAPTR